MRIRTALRRGHAIMAAMAVEAECFVCRKHRERGALVPGGPAGLDDLVMVSHLAPVSSGRPVYLPGAADRRRSWSVFRRPGPRDEHREKPEDHVVAQGGL